MYTVLCLMQIILDGQYVYSKGKYRNRDRNSGEPTSLFIAKPLGEYPQTKKRRKKQTDSDPEESVAEMQVKHVHLTKCACGSLSR